MARSLKAFAASAVVLFASAARAQPGGSQGGFYGFGGPGEPQSGVMFLEIDEVRAELATNNEQNTRLDELGRDARAQAQDAFSYWRELRNLSDEERDKRREEARKKLEQINKGADAKLAEILEHEQLVRLKQLKLQREGIMAIARPDVADMLTLTQEQKDKVAQAVEAYRSRRNLPNFRDLSDEERDKYFAQRREQREKTEADLLALLTEDQKQKWEEAQGEKFTFSEGGGQGR